MRRSAILLFTLLPACVMGPFDLDYIEKTGPLTFSGYARSASATVRVLALNQSSGAWQQIGTAVSSSSPDVPAGVWAGNPNLYSWTVNVSLSFCQLNPQCVAQMGTFGTSTPRLRFEHPNGDRLIVFDENWTMCMGERTSRGLTFDRAAYDCRVASYPDLRLRLTFTGTDITLENPRFWPSANLAAVRNDTRIALYYFFGPAIARLEAEIEVGAMDDMSEVGTGWAQRRIFAARRNAFGNGEIVAYDLSSSSPDVPSAGQVVGSYSTAGSVHISATSELVAWRDGGSGMHTARWTPGGAWTTSDVGKTANLSGRPNLFIIGHAPFSSEDRTRPTYARGVQVVALSSTSRIHVMRMEKSLVRRELEDTFDIYRTTATSGCGSDPNIVDPVWIEDLAGGDLWTLDRLGYYLWELPAQLRPVLRQMAVRDCLAGRPVQPASANRACELAKWPVVYASFQQDSCLDGSCGDDPCPGFRDDQEMLGPEQAFADLLWAYLSEGDRVRQDVRRDLNRPLCNDLLARKYNWLRENVFHGWDHLPESSGGTQTLCP